MNKPHWCVGGELSYEFSSWRYDARGIALARVCPKCVKEKLSKFKPEVLTNPQYDCDERVDE